MQHEQTEERTHIQTPSPISPKGCSQTLMQVGCLAGSRGPWRGGSSRNAPPYILQNSRPPSGPPRTWVRKGVNARGASSAENLSARYLELLLSSVIIQHQLLLLCTADDRFSGWGPLSPLQRRGQSRLWITALLQGPPGKSQ